MSLYRIDRRSLSFLFFLQGLYGALPPPCLHHDACGASVTSNLAVCTWPISAIPLQISHWQASYLPTASWQRCIGVYTNQFASSHEDNLSLLRSCVSRSIAHPAQHTGLVREALPAEHSSS